MAQSSFNFELAVLRAKNTDSVPKGGNLFVRFYLSAAGKKQRIRLHTRQVDDPAAGRSWDEAFSLQCSGAEDSIEELKNECLIFELRQKRRRRAVILGGASSSKLLGSAEFPWRTVFEAPNTEVETWVPMIPSSGSSLHGELKPPSLRVSMKIRPGSEVAGEIIRTRQGRRKKMAGESGCGCRERCDQPWGCGCGDEYFSAMAMAAAMDAF